MCKENLWNDIDREIDILGVKYDPILLRLPQNYVEKPGFESDPLGE
jgi:hypothetical protein